MKCYYLIIVLFVFACRNTDSEAGKNVVFYKNWKLDLDNLELMDTSLIIQDYRNVLKMNPKKICVDSLPVVKKGNVMEYLYFLNGVLTYKIDRKCKWNYDTKMNYNCMYRLISGDSLFVTAYSGRASGSIVFCLDLETGKEIWQGELEQFPVNHSQYWNTAELKKLDNRLILAVEEGAGDQLQVLDCSTGENLFNVSNIPPIQVSGDH